MDASSIFYFRSCGIPPWHPCEGRETRAFCVKDETGRTKAIPGTGVGARAVRVRLTRSLRWMPATIALTSMLAGCPRNDDAADRARIQPMLGAVMHSDTVEVLRLAELHAGLDERLPDVGETPMIFASQTDQWPVVEILIDHGADIWAHDRFGITTAQATVTSRILRGSDEDRARVRVIATLQARGYPFPPPDPDRILELERLGRWPPSASTRPMADPR